MPQLNVAPSPSPVVVPPASANAAAPDTSSAAASASGSGAAENSQAQPFAAVLRHQMSQKDAGPSKEASDKAAPADIAATLAEAPKAANEPPPDALAAIAQMLTGIVPPAPATEEPGIPGTKGKKADAEDSQDPALSATAGLPGLAAIVPPAGQTPVAAKADVPDAAVGIAPRANQTEIIAADVQETASSAASSKQEGADFASLLATPRDMQAAAAAQVHANSHAAPAAEANAARIQTPVGARGWDNEIGDKLTWMVTKHETSANLVLNPPQMGRIEVSISMHGDQATANFASANAAVRDAIQDALPRLREILQDAGISLGQTQVGSESFQQSAGNRENGDNSWRGGNQGEAGTDLAQNGILRGGTAPILHRGNGLVDTFA